MPLELYRSIKYLYKKTVHFQVGWISQIMELNLKKLAYIHIEKAGTCYNWTFFVNELMPNVMIQKLTHEKLTHEE